jgi:hypothetical protein
LQSGFLQADAQDWAYVDEYFHWSTATAERADTVQTQPLTRLPQIMYMLSSKVLPVLHMIGSRCGCLFAARYFLRNAAETQVSEVELFLNSVPILNPLSQEEKLQLVDAFEEKTYKPGEQVRTQQGSLASAVLP